MTVSMGRLEPSKDNSVVGSDATMAEGKIVNVTAIYIGHTCGSAGPADVTSLWLVSQSDLGSRS